MDIVLHLGGNVNRTYKAAEIAAQFPLTKIIVSSEGGINQVLDIYKEKGITQDRIDLDFAAWDTVTNFTETKNKIIALQPKKLYVVTDEFHMRRSMTIARLCYFDTDIEIIPCSSLYNSPDVKESTKLVLYDAIRSGIWARTSHLLYDTKIKANRWPGIQAEEQTAKIYCW
jgi:uncharacterized SAM-binding protein YcdF (DUF218 family)